MYLCQQLSSRQGTGWDALVPLSSPPAPASALPLGEEQTASWQKELGSQNSSARAPEKHSRMCWSDAWICLALELGSSSECESGSVALEVGWGERGTAARGTQTAGWKRRSCWDLESWYVPSCSSGWVSVGETQGIPLMEVHLEYKVFHALSRITKLDKGQQEQLQLKNASVCFEGWAMLWFEFL